MDYDRAPPMPVANYRDCQRALPGREGLYAALRAILDANLPKAARILIVGAGGGRELESLGASPRRYDLVGVDPSADMLALARAHGGQIAPPPTLIQGTVDGLGPLPAFDAATSVLVMHFLPDDGAKAAYLTAIRQRLRPGAHYLHADVSLDGRGMFDLLAPAFRAHAEQVGLEPAIAQGACDAIAAMAFERLCVISEARTVALFEAAGFRLVAPFFRALWYVGWWAQAA